ncbi:AEC family transporter [Avibacterium paragallinarum]|uniref:AEC family transporter n=1 Tax=Avibacterium paragallinarum TaxID=728 RepID=UPI00397B8F2C
MQNDFWGSILFSISVTLPTLFLLILGIFLRKRNVIDDRFSQQATGIVFKITLPALLFLNVFQNPIKHLNEQLMMIWVCVFGTLLLFLLSEIFAEKFVADKRERGTFVQGVYRGNCSILGLAFCLNAYGEAALVPATIYAATTAIAYNILGVITLSRSLSNGKVNVQQMIINVVKNPLIISILLGFIASYLKFTIPKFILTTTQYLASMTLPLALICAGVNIELKALYRISGISLWASVGRLIIAPIFMVWLGKLCGFNGVTLGVIFLMNATPMAAAAYAMVRGMGGNANTAANIIGITSFASMFISAIGLVILHQIGWV